MDLSDSLGQVNLSDILDKTLEGTSEMLQLLEEEETTAITSTTVPSSTDNTFLNEKFKWLKASTSTALPSIRII